MMTDSELAEIRARVEAATPGPWIGTTVDSISGGSIYGEGWIVASAEIYPNGVANSPSSEGYLPAYPTVPIDTDANADFIAHAPTDVLALLAQVERLWEIARVVAAEDATIAYNDARPNPNYCVFCEADYAWPQTGVDHTTDCPVTLIRALLASEQPSH